MLCLACRVFLRHVNWLPRLKSPSLHTALGFWVVFRKQGGGEAGAPPLKMGTASGGEGGHKRVGGPRRVGGLGRALLTGEVQLNIPGSDTDLAWLRALA